MVGLLNGWGNESAHTAASPHSHGFSIKTEPAFPGKMPMFFRFHALSLRRRRLRSRDGSRVLPWPVSSFTAVNIRTSELPDKQRPEKYPGSREILAFAPPAFTEVLTVFSKVLTVFSLSTFVFPKVLSVFSTARQPRRVPHTCSADGGFFPRKRRRMNKKVYICRIYRPWPL